MRKITEIEETRRLLDIGKEWIIYRKVHDWQLEDFNLNSQDVDAIIGDLEDKYFSNSQRPSVELHEDGKVVVKYPTCRLETK